MKVKYDELLKKAIDERYVIELATGYLRYEALRKLGPHQYKNLCMMNLKGHKFDHLVDELVVNPGVKWKYEISSKSN